ncbi:MAG TPA: hypothetical protein VEB64_06960 [Azospirillaceae bacterium]|nr:hypothetical protein [Azospirillaceae bacterium]
MLSVLEVAVFALVLMGQPEAFTCVTDGIDGINCTNGMSASPDENGDIRFRSGVTVIKDRRTGTLSFSNGITTHMDVAGWVQFSSGVSAVRDNWGFRFNNGFVCRQTARDTAKCYSKAK